MPCSLTLLWAFIASWTESEVFSAMTLGLLFVCASALAAPQQASVTMGGSKLHSCIRPAEKEV